jgi:hypothetical protein
MLDNAGVSKTEDGISTKVSYGLCELKIFFVLVTRRLMIIVTIKLIRSQLAGRLFAIRRPEPAVLLSNLKSLVN